MLKVFTRSRYPFVQRSFGFTLIEVLMTTALLVLIISILIPVLGKARETARYTAWLSMSKSMEADPRIALYYNFEAQTGDELSASGEQIVLNRANGDSMAVISSEGSSVGADDPELRYSAMRDSHPDNDEKGALPTFEERGGRLTGKTAMRFYGKSKAQNKAPKEGSYLQPEHWAGVVRNAEFQVALWMKITDHAKTQKPISWGSRSVFFSVQAHQSEYKTMKVYNDSKSAYTFGGGKKVDIFDDQWHFVVAKVEMPFGTDGNNADPTVPEMSDVQISVDGSEFMKADVSGSDNRELIRESLELRIAAEADKVEDFAQGIIDEVIIWQEPTPFEEIRAMYRTGAPYGHGRAFWYAAN